MTLSARVHWLLLAVHGSHWTCSERALTKRGFSVHNYVHLGSPSAENSLSINELGTR
ncbi:hypothetical protein PO78_4396 [Thauera sp. SWB20]|nr:hypothetical protein PO78_4396 [Thauera sp. SWB20]